MSIQQNIMELTEPVAEEIETLLEQARQGSQNAIAVLINQFSPRLYRCIRRALTRSSRRMIDSDDIAQSVWKSIFAAQDNRYLNAIKSPAHLRGILARMAFNKTIDKGRRDIAQQRCTRNLCSAFENNRIGASVAEKRIPSASERVIAQETLERLLTSVPEKYTEVIRQRLSGASISEISGDLGIPLRSLHRILQNARRQLDE